MKIALITGSRSDRNALEMVKEVLQAAGHDMATFNVEPMEATPRFTPGEVLERAIFSVRHRLRDWPVDLAIVHGDRHEVLAAAMTVNLLGIPIAHLGGGDITEGSQDDCFRHAITKLSHLHFASNQDSADRIVQMGEEPERVHVTGCPGIDMVMATPTGNRYQTFRDVGLSDGPIVPQKCLLVLFHPNTLGDTRAELEAISAALTLRTESLVLIGPNADAGSDLIRREWQRLAAERPDTVYHDNVEPQVFYSLMKWCDVMVGNSSAGFYEAPCFGIPVLNIGKRQLGRTWPSNVETCLLEVDDVDVGYLVEHLCKKISFYTSGRIGKQSEVSNPYGDGHAAERIAKVIGEIKEPKALLRKRFHHNQQGAGT